MEIQNETQKKGGHANLPPLKRGIILAINAIVPIVFASFLTSAKPILSIGGAIGSNCYNLICPCIIYMMVMIEDGYKWHHPIFLTLSLVLLFAGSIAIFATYQSIRDAIDSFKSYGSN